MSPSPRATTRDRGAVIPIVALALPVIILMVAFAVDLGMQRANRRTMQARADIIALDLGRLANGRTLLEIMTDTSPSYFNALQGAADRNEVPVSDLTVEFGTWDGTTFDPLVPGVDDALSPNAVRVTGSREQRYHFQPGSGSATRVAIALNGWAGPPCATPPCPPPATPPGTPPGTPLFGDAVVDLTVGSVGAGFQPSVPNSATLNATVTVLNSRLAAQFGASVPSPGTAGFDLVGYRGLAAAEVDLYRMAASLGLASPDQLLASNLTVGQFFGAAVDALDQQADDGDGNAADAAAELSRFQSQMIVNNTATLRLGDAISYAQGGDSAAATGSVNVLDLLSIAGELINGTNFATYGMSSGIPGVTIVDLDQYLVSKPTVRKRLHVGGTAVNKQMNFQLTFQVAVAGMPSPLQIPVIIEAASATGTVLAGVCAEPRLGSAVDIGVDTTAMEAHIGTASAAALSTPNPTVTAGVMLGGGAFSVNALISLGLTLSQALGFNLAGQTTGTSYARLGGNSTDLTFFPFQDPNPFQRAPGGIGVGSIGSTLKTSFAAYLGGTVLPAAARTNILSKLTTFFDNIDASVIDPLLAANGVTIAGADVLADNLECTGAGVILIS